jgi:hypothetical protein
MLNEMIFNGSHEAEFWGSFQSLIHRLLVYSHLLAGG